MTDITALILGTLQITLLDLALSGDNIGIIALATRNLSEKHAKKASIVGIGGAVGLRILFACFITLIINIQWLPIKLLGGLLLIKITWDFIKPQGEEENTDIKVADRFLEAVGIIILADISMSLDNVLAIASAANGRIVLIVFGILLNIPILFFGSQFVANLMKKYSIVVYIAGAILAHTASKMILEDRLISSHIPISADAIIPWIAAAAVLAYGLYSIRRRTAPDSVELEIAADEEKNK